MDLKEFNLANREIYIQGDISEESSAQLLRDIRNLKGTDKAIVDYNNTVLRYIYDAERNGIELPEFPLPQAHVFLTSGGGFVYNGLAMFDSLVDLSNYCPTDITASGICGSAAFLIFLGIPYENRKCTMNTEFLVHQVSCGYVGTTAAIEEGAADLKRLNQKMFDIISKNTKITKEKLKKVYDGKKDWYFDAKTAKELGVVSEIV